MKAWWKQNLGKAILFMLVVAFVAVLLGHKKSGPTACAVKVRHNGSEVAFCTATNPQELRIRDSSKEAVRLTWTLSAEDVALLGDDIAPKTFSIKATRTSSHVTGFPRSWMGEVASNASDFIKTPRIYQLKVVATPVGDGNAKIGLKVNFG